MEISEPGSVPEDAIHNGYFCFKTAPEECLVPASAQTHVLQLGSNLAPVNTGALKSFGMDKRATKGGIVDIEMGIGLGARSPGLLGRILVDGKKNHTVALQIGDCIGQGRREHLAVGAHGK